MEETLNSVIESLKSCEAELEVANEIKECAEIVKNHSEEFSCCNNDFERQELLENLWIKIHKSKFDKDKIVFENNNDMMMFILKNQ